MTFTFIMFPSHSDPESNVFVVSVNLKPGRTTEFTLTYQILLPRRRGVYKQYLGLFPGQVNTLSSKYAKRGTK